jgi:predicted oxidoreductase
MESEDKLELSQRLAKAIYHLQKALRIKAIGYSDTEDAIYEILKKLVGIRSWFCFDQMGAGHTIPSIDPELWEE